MPLITVIVLVVLCLVVQLVASYYASRRIWACPDCGTAIKISWRRAFFKVYTSASSQENRKVRLKCPQCEKVNNCTPSYKGVLWLAPLQISCRISDGTLQSVT
jgi:predicted RNA-binding Zn-ribbon protein involved in translation (DUF1610 family)